MADNIWCFTLAPTVREWFGAENAANIQNVCILFRNDEALTDEKKTSDFFITVTGDKTFTPAPVEIAACPVEEAGIHPSADGTSVTFALYDLDTDNNYKDYACLIGDFNDWELSTEYQMKRDNDKHFWWYTEMCIRDRIYGTLGLTGQKGPDGSGDLDDIDEGTSSFYRMTWCANQLMTDEAIVNSWNDAGVATIADCSWSCLLYTSRCV